MSNSLGCAGGTRVASTAAALALCDLPAGVVRCLARLLLVLPVSVSTASERKRSEAVHARLLEGAELLHLTTNGIK